MDQTITCADGLKELFSRLPIVYNSGHGMRHSSEISDYDGYVRAVVDKFGVRVNATKKLGENLYSVDKNKIPDRAHILKVPGDSEKRVVVSNADLPERMYIISTDAGMQKALYSDLVSGFTYYGEKDLNTLMLEQARISAQIIKDVEEKHGGLKNPTVGLFYRAAPNYRLQDGLADNDVECRIVGAKLYYRENEEQQQDGEAYMKHYMLNDINIEAGSEDFGELERLPAGSEIDLIVPDTHASGKTILAGLAYMIDEFSKRNIKVRKLITYGWTSLESAMLINRYSKEMGIKEFIPYAVESFTTLDMDNFYNMSPVFTLHRAPGLMMPLQDVPETVRNTMKNYRFIITDDGIVPVEFIANSSYVLDKSVTKNDLWFVPFYEIPAKMQKELAEKYPEAFLFSPEGAVVPLESVYKYLYHAAMKNDGPDDFSQAFIDLMYSRWVVKFEPDKIIKHFDHTISNLGNYKERDLERFVYLVPEFMDDEHIVTVSNKIIERKLDVKEVLPAFIETFAVSLN